jgi:hypothetical protein
MIGALLVELGSSAASDGLFRHRDGHLVEPAAMP